MLKMECTKKQSGAVADLIFWLRHEYSIHLLQKNSKMKNLKFSILALIVVAATFVTAQAQTADEIIQKHIAAIGGADNWKKIKSMKITGAINAGGTEIPVTFTMIQNKALRFEFSINGMNNYSIITQKEGWMYFPAQGQTKPEAMTPEMVKQSKDDLDMQGPLIDYKTKGNKVAYLGKDDVEGTECFKLKVTYPSGKEETMFIDASNYYHIRSVEKIKADGKEQEQVNNYSNYQKLPEGIVFPMTMDSGNGPINLKTTEINKPVDESIFKPKG